MRRVLMLLLFTSVALAQPPQTQRYQNLLKELRCLVCQNQDLLDSHAPLAEDLKQRVRVLMEKGETDEAIKQHLTARFGDFILFKPPVKPSTFILWGAPVFLLGFAFLFLFLKLRLNHGRI